MRLSQAGQQHQVRRVHVDTTQLDLNRKFELSVVQPPNNDDSADETKYYQLKQLDHCPQDMKVIFPRRVLPEKKLVEVCCPLPKTLNLFQTKICNFRHSNHELNKNLIPYLRLDS